VIFYYGVLGYRVLLRASSTTLYGRFSRFSRFSRFLGDF